MIKKHIFIMLLCCLVPIATLAVIILFNFPIKTGLYIGLILLYPLSHLLIMKYMRHDFLPNHKQVSNKE
jgi:hypothetical protein